MTDEAEAFQAVMKSMGDAAMKARRAKYQPKKPPQAEQPAAQSNEPSVEELQALIGG